MTTPKPWTIALFLWGIALLPVLSFATPFNNISQGKSANQSSSNYGGGKGAASLAVDGNTSGNWGNGSVTHTKNEANPWWEIDLGNTFSIDQVRIFNRTDCCADRLSEFAILIKKERKDPGIMMDMKRYSNTDFVDGMLQVTGHQRIYEGRFIRIQLYAKAPLSLAEVQVSGFLPPEPEGRTVTRTIVEACNKKGHVLHNAHDSYSSLYSYYVKDGCDPGRVVRKNIQVGFGSPYTISQLASINNDGCSEIGTVGGMVFGDRQNWAPACQIHDYMWIVPAPEGKKDQWREYADKAFLINMYSVCKEIWPQRSTGLDGCYDGSRNTYNLVSSFGKEMFDKSQKQGRNKEIAPLSATELEAIKNYIDRFQLALQANTDFGQPLMIEETPTWLEEPEFLSVKTSKRFTFSNSSAYTARFRIIYESKDGVETMWRSSFLANGDSEDFLLQDDQLQILWIEGSYRSGLNPKQIEVGSEIIHKQAKDVQTNWKMSGAVFTTPSFGGTN